MFTLDWASREDPDQPVALYTEQHATDFQTAFGKASHSHGCFLTHKGEQGRREFYFET